MWYKIGFRSSWEISSPKVLLTLFFDMIVFSFLVSTQFSFHCKSDWGNNSENVFFTKMRFLLAFSVSIYRWKRLPFLWKCTKWVDIDSITYMHLETNCVNLVLLPHIHRQHCKWNGFFASLNKLSNKKVFLRIHPLH